eukprot:GFUD01004440.1.p1 GENE.GFUD01004440.1~~GFUD01004440.1.p1  ORF type:complete len:393 (+),score=99.68 GFUD01004440.1:92-1270(+)
MLRQRRKPVTQIVTELDAFPKIPETYVEQTASGAYVAIITFFLVVLMVYSEMNYFFWPALKFRFAPDADMFAKLKFNVDMTVAMPCDLIGADILDKTNQNAFTFGRLKEEPTWWELDADQRIHFDEVQRLNQYLREEYHQLQDVLWKSGYSRLYADLPARKIQPETPHDACRVHGSLTLNKVAGNFHVTAGKVLPIMGAHAHMTGFMETRDYNFSHRIEKLTFGDNHAGIIQPLEGDEKLTDINLMNFQYFVEIVPTEVSGLTGKKTTYQYSVKDHVRPIDHSHGSHGTPGIYFKYDISALKVEVTKDREGFFQFLVRLCASVGGLVATSAIVCGLVKNFISFVCCWKAPDTPTKSQPNGVKPEAVSMLAAVDLTVPKHKIQPPQKSEVKSS